jgi:hypothetical protein
MNGDRSQSVTLLENRGSVPVGCMGWESEERPGTCSFPESLEKIKFEQVMNASIINVQNSNC